jgi:hypothetical protein
MQQSGKVVPETRALPKQRISALLAAGWARVALKHGKGVLADGIDATEKTVENAMAGRTLPELHTALNSLAVDRTALDEVFASYGLRICPLHSLAANDIETAAGVINAMGELVRSLDDGQRDHLETLSIAALIRPHMPALQAIVSEADKLRGAA